MSEYKRFVSYIYAYDKGTKNKNVGFAKVEARSGQCRIFINLKGAYIGNGKEQQVYLFYRNGEQLLGTYMGSFVIKNGIGEFKDVTDSDNIKNSGHSLNQMAGILIRSPEQENQVYASGWDDHALLVEKFVMEDKINTQKSGQIKSGESISENTKIENAKLEETASQPKPNVQMYMDKAQPTSVIQFPDRNQKLSSSEQKTKEEAKSMSLLEAVKLKEENVMIQDLEMKEGEENHKIKLREALQANFAQNQPIQETQGENLKKQVEIQRKEIERIQSQAETKAEEKKIEPLQEEDKLGLKAQEERGEKLWERLINQFPKVIAFEDEPDIMCLKIDLKDLENLPKENWILGNNSFLLHGYYNFRYLLLARLKENEYILGVPGMYHNKERFMAAMFGFEAFKTVIPCKQKTGQFGYWYQSIKI